MSVELTPELIKELASARNGFYSWDYVAGLAVWIIGVEAENERLRCVLQEIAEDNSYREDTDNEVGWHIDNAYEVMNKLKLKSKQALNEVKDE